MFFRRSTVAKPNIQIIGIVISKPNLVSRRNCLLQTKSGYSENTYSWLLSEDFSEKVEWQIRLFGEHVQLTFIGEFQWKSGVTHGINPRFKTRIQSGQLRVFIQNDKMANFANLGGQNVKIMGQADLSRLIVRGRGAHSQPRPTHSPIYLFIPA